MQPDCSENIFRIDFAIGEHRCNFASSSIFIMFGISLFRIDPQIFELPLRANTSSQYWILNQIHSSHSFPIAQFSLQMFLSLQISEVGGEAERKRKVVSFRFVFVSSVRAGVRSGCLVEFYIKSCRLTLPFS